MRTVSYIGWVLALAAGLAAVPLGASASPLVGNAQTVVRKVSGILEDTTEQTIFVNSDVFQDEDIVTGPQSATRIIFKDGTNLEMGENSRLKLTKVVFDPDPSKSAIAAKAIAGVFRWTSGNLPHESYKLGTPVATIGIRGTTIEMIVAESGLSTIALARGGIEVTNLKGASVTLKPGEATTVLPADGDGNQQPPSDPAPIPPDFLKKLWTMTVVIRNADPPGDIVPAGGPGGGAPPPHRTSGNDSGGPPTINSTPPLPIFPSFQIGGGGAPPLVPPQTTQKTSSPGGPGPNPTPGPGPGGGGKDHGSGSGGGGTIVVDSPGPPAPLTKVLLPAIFFSAPGGKELEIKATQGALLLDSLKVTGDGSPFSVPDFKPGTAITLGRMLELLVDFMPPPGDHDLFDAMLEFFDKTDNVEIDVPLIGMVDEPASLALLGMATGALLWLRRRKAARS